MWSAHGRIPGYENVVRVVGCVCNVDRVRLQLFGRQWLFGVASVQGRVRPPGGRVQQPRGHGLGRVVRRQGLRERRQRVHHRASATFCLLCDGPNIVRERAPPRRADRLLDSLGRVSRLREPGTERRHGRWIRRQSEWWYGRRWRLHWWNRWKLWWDGWDDDGGYRRRWRWPNLPDRFPGTALHGTPNVGPCSDCLPPGRLLRRDVGVSRRRAVLFVRRVRKRVLASGRNATVVWRRLFSLHAGSNAVHHVPNLRHDLRRRLTQPDGVRRPTRARHGVARPAPGLRRCNSEFAGPLHQNSAQIRVREAQWPQAWHVHPPTETR